METSHISNRTRMLYLKGLIIALVLSFNVQASLIEFTITHGIVCKLDGACSTNSDAFFDPSGSFQANVNSSGIFAFSDPFQVLFNGNTQFFDISVLGGVLNPADVQSGLPVADNTIPSGIWDGTMNYTTSSGGSGTFLLDGNNSGYYFFIDNVDLSFTLSVMDPFGTNPPGNNGIGASFYIVGTTALVNSDPPTIPEPSTLAIFALGVVALTLGRFKKQS